MQPDAGHSESETAREIQGIGVETIHIVEGFYRPDEDHHQVTELRLRVAALEAEIRIREEIRRGIFTPEEAAYRILLGAYYNGLVQPDSTGMVSYQSRQLYGLLLYSPQLPNLSNSDKLALAKAYSIAIRDSGPFRVEDDERATAKRKVREILDRYADTLNLSSGLRVQDSWE